MGLVNNTQRGLICLLSPVQYPEFTLCGDAFDSSEQDMDNSFLKTTPKM